MTGEAARASGATGLLLARARRAGVSAAKRTRDPERPGREASGAAGSGVRKVRQASGCRGRTRAGQPAPGSLHFEGPTFGLPGDSFLKRPVPHLGGVGCAPFAETRRIRLGSLRREPTDNCVEVAECLVTVKKKKKIKNTAVVVANPRGNCFSN